VVVGEKLRNLEGKAHVSELDVTSMVSINTFKLKVGDAPVDVLLNIAGEVCPGRQTTAHLTILPGVMAPKEQDGLTTTTHSVLEKTFAVNTYGPLLLTQALLPNILKASSPKIGNMVSSTTMEPLSNFLMRMQSSRVGSIADNSSGGSYAYRASKAALNSIGKSMAVDLKEKGVTVIMMHPGYVKTALDTSGYTHSLPEAVEPEEAASKLWKVLKSKNIEDTGTFWHREGQELPW
jgi:NAD(P)-dependent dehydrogenase (short-subunit alcohol dehydrogenase family)